MGNPVHLWGIRLTALTVAAVFGWIGGPYALVLPLVLLYIATDSEAVGRFMDLGTVPLSIVGTLITTYVMAAYLAGQAQRAKAARAAGE